MILQMRIFQLCTSSKVSSRPSILLLPQHPCESSGRWPVWLYFGPVWSFGGRPALQFSRRERDALNVTSLGGHFNFCSSCFNFYTSNWGFLEIMTKLDLEVFSWISLETISGWFIDLSILIKRSNNMCSLYSVEHSYAGWRHCTVQCIAVLYSTVLWSCWCHKNLSNCANISSFRICEGQMRDSAVKQNCTVQCTTLYYIVLYNVLHCTML